MSRDVPRWLVWATLFGAGVAYEVHELRGHTGGTLSEIVREASRIDTPAGRAVFVVGWGGFSAWFAAHIIGGRSDPEWVAYLAAKVEQLADDLTN